MSTINNFTGKIFFYLVPQGSPENANYQHGMICLAEGLKSLGIPFYSNINYWRTSTEREEYLFCYNPEITPDDCSVVVLDLHWFGCGNPFPENLFHSNRKYITVCLDSADGLRTLSWEHEFRQFDFIFKAHYNSRCSYPSNFQPWAFGISNRIRRETEEIPTFQARKRCIIANFRVLHPLRKKVRKKFFPKIQKLLPLDESIDAFDIPQGDTYDYLEWVQTGRRHYPDYYKRLKQSVACACFGGMLMGYWPEDPTVPIRGNLDKILRKILKELDVRPKRIAQWDSWRLWESLAAGCVTFHVDFDKHGLLLPVMPENWRHYIGIDLYNIQASVERIADEPEILKTISTEGRLWALEHYSPVPTTLRFLETIHNRFVQPENLVVPQ